MRPLFHVLLWKPRFSKLPVTCSVGAMSLKCFRRGFVLLLGLCHGVLAIGNGWQVVHGAYFSFTDSSEIESLLLPKRGQSSL